MKLSYFCKINDETKIVIQKHRSKDGELLQILWKGRFKDLKEWEESDKWKIVMIIPQGIDRSIVDFSEIKEFIITVMPLHAEIMKIDIHGM